MLHTTPSTCSNYLCISALRHTPQREQILLQLTRLAKHVPPSLMTHLKRIASPLLTVVLVERARPALDTVEPWPEQSRQQGKLQAELPLEWSLRRLWATLLGRLSHDWDATCQAMFLQNLSSFFPLIPIWPSSMPIDYCLGPTNCLCFRFRPDSSLKVHLFSSKDSKLSVFCRARQPRRVSRKSQ